jgi:hypothetical protein
MKVSVSFMVFGLLCQLFGGESPAQQTTLGNPGAPTLRARVVLPEGTEVVLKLAQDVNSKTAKPGELVEFVVAEPVKVGDVVVADAGARAIGNVVHSKTPDFWGNPGEMNVRMTFLKAGKTKVPLRGAMGEVGSIRVVIRGSQAVLKKGVPAKAYVDSDTVIECSGTSTTSGSALPAAVSDTHRIE